MGQVGLDDAPDDRAAVDRRQLLPPEPSRDDLAGAIIRMARYDDLADRERAHHRADRHRRGIVSLVGDPAAHRGLDREEFVADEDLPLRRSDDRGIANGEILGLRDSRRPGDKNHLTIAHPDLAPNASLVRSHDSFATWPPPGKDIVAC